MSGKHQQNPIRKNLAVSLVADVASELESTRWQNLLQWLQKHGMKSKFRVERRPCPGAGFGLFASEPCPAGEPLFKIPPTALINVTTLASQYPSSESLTPTQVMSLQLFLSAPEGGQDSADDTYGPFISILPREFHSHPLTWVVLKKLTSRESVQSSMLNLVPHSVTALLLDLERRFWEDWSSVLKYMKIHALPWEKQTVELNYLCAWLNVNTRCIYHRLKQSRSNAANVTLCPVLDFANHSWKNSHMNPVSNAETWNTAPSPKHGDEFCFLASTPIARGQEIFLTYGSHPNSRLFVEYGFVNDVSETLIRTGEYPAEADIQLQVVSLFKNVPTGVWMKEVLEEEGYWGDWTIHSSPFPASPSFRVICALRLYALFHQHPTLPDDSQAMLNVWRNTVIGIQDRISDENERSWRAALQGICEEIVADSCAGKFKTASFSIETDDEGWLLWMKSNVESLWQEQILVAESLLQSIRDGVEF